jgi:hypothetical protein
VQFLLLYNLHDQYACPNGVNFRERGYVHFIICFFLMYSLLKNIVNLYAAYIVPSFFFVIRPIPFVSVVYFGVYVTGLGHYGN